MGNMNGEIPVIGTRPTASSGGGIDLVTNGQINSLTDKSTVVDADVTIIEDSAATFAKKKVLFSVIKEWIQDWLSTFLVQGSGMSLTYDDAANTLTLASIVDATKENVSNKSTTTTLGGSDTLYPTQNAVKTYVDNLITGLKWKQSVLVSTTANITLSGEQTIDGVTTSASRVLVKNQSTGSENGIYTSAAGAWTRTTDADAGTELVNATVFIEQGTVSADTAWVCTNNSITIGSTSLVFAQMYGAGAYTAPTIGSTVINSGTTVTNIVGLTLTGPVLGVATATSLNGLTITTTSGTLTMANTKTLTVSNTITFAGTDSTTMTFPSANATIVGTTATQTLTNKRIDPRLQSVASNATVTPNSDTDDAVIITAQAAGLTLANPSGTPVQGQPMIIRIKDNATARAITFGSQYRGIGAALPTTTTISKTLYISMIYNSTDVRWDVIFNQEP